MRVGIVIEETWDFFHEICAHLSQSHETSFFQRKSVTLPVFNGRVNQVLFRHSLQEFMRHNDVVFFEWASELLAAATCLPKQCGIVTRLHRYELYEWADRINWNAVDTIILVSEAKRQEFVARFPEQASKVIVIPEAVSLRRFQLQLKPFTGDLGTLCHLRPRKRVYELILVFYELLRMNRNFHLHIGGGTAASFEDYEASLHSLVERLDIASHVTFYGNVTKPEEWYRHIDILISNSYSEGLQVAPLEAMASGCYCLSHRWEGADELFEDPQLFFTSRELQERILNYCELTETERKLWRIQAHARVRENFNVDRTKVQIEQLINRVGLTVA